MMTSMPRVSAEEAYSKSRSGVRWAETTRVSWGIPNSSSVLAACSRVSQSDEEPMIIPTRGLLAKRNPLPVQNCTTGVESDILRRFSAGGDLRALLPILAKVPDKIERAGDEDSVLRH